MFTALVLLITGVSLAASADDDVAAAVVADPEAPTTTAAVAEVTTIAPSTSEAPVPVIVPPLGGLKQSEARTLLRDLGLDVMTSFMDATVGYAIGLVVASNPPEGTTLFRGDRVDVTFGRRPKPVTAQRATPFPWAGVETVDVVDRAVGRCRVGRLDGTLVTLDPADCAGPHDFQYLATVRVDGPYPSQPDAYLALRAICDEQFATFVGAPLTGSMLDIYIVSGWDSNSGAAEGSCLTGHRTAALQLIDDALGSLW